MNERYEERHRRLEELREEALDEAKPILPRLEAAVRRLHLMIENGLREEGGEGDD